MGPFLVYGFTALDRLYQGAIEPVRRSNASSASDGRPNFATEAYRPPVKITSLKAHRYYTAKARLGREYLCSGAIVASADVDESGREPRACKWTGPRAVSGSLGEHVDARGQHTSVCT